MTSWAIPIMHIMDILPIFPAQHPSVLPIVYNHVQALVIGLDVIFVHSGNFIASSGFPISPYPSSPCCMYFLLGVKSLFFIWVNTAEVLVPAARPVLPHLTHPPPSPPPFLVTIWTQVKPHITLQWSWWMLTQCDFCPVLWMPQWRSSTKCG